MNYSEELGVGPLEKIFDHDMKLCSEQQDRAITEFTISGSRGVLIALFDPLSRVGSAVLKRIL